MDDSRDVWQSRVHVMKIPVTVAVPVKNEEKNLTRCLERLSRFAEIVVIDSNSTDQTRQIARLFEARIVNFEWDGRFPKKRNWFLINEPPTQPWVLFLDADEFVNEAFCDAIASAVEDTTHDAFWLNYANYFLGKPLKYGIAQRKLALFRVGKALYERIEEDGWSQLDMEIHEHPIVSGTVGEISERIDHQDYKGLGKFIEKHRDYALWEAQRFAALSNNTENPDHFTSRQKFKYKNISKWWYPWFYFCVNYFWKLGFLDGKHGFYHSYYKTWYFHTIRLIIAEQDLAK